MLMDYLMTIPKTFLDNDFLIYLVIVAIGLIIFSVGYTMIMVDWFKKDEASVYNSILIDILGMVFNVVLVLLGLVLLLKIATWILL